MSSSDQQSLGFLINYVQRSTTASCICRTMNHISLFTPTFSIPSLGYHIPKTRLYQSPHVELRYWLDHGEFQSILHSQTLWLSLGSMMEQLPLILQLHYSPGFRRYHSTNSHSHSLLLLAFRQRCSSSELDSSQYHRIDLRVSRQDTSYPTAYCATDEAWLLCCQYQLETSIDADYSETMSMSIDSGFEIHPLKSADHVNDHPNSLLQRSIEDHW